MRSPARIARHRHCQRGGSVLVLVAVIVVLLSLSAYTFSDLMHSEYRAVHAAHETVQLRAAAESGVEAAAAFLEDPLARSRESTSDNPRRFRQILIDTAGDLWFSVSRSRDAFDPLHYVADEPEASEHGLWNESAKLNLNRLPLTLTRRTEARKSLLAIPRMTGPIAEAILQHLERAEQRTGQASDTSPRGTRVYAPRLRSLDELLKVRGVTPQLLYGDSLARTGAGRDMRGRKPGWDEYLTVVSAERNQHADGTPRIHVNDPDLGRLYDQLKREFNRDTARFIVAWRMVGSTDEDLAPDDEPDRDDQSPEAQLARQRAAERRAIEQLGGDPTSDDPSSHTQRPRSLPLRDGLDLNRPGKYQIGSWFNLIEAKVRIDIDGQEAILVSPWRADRQQLPRTWQDLSERLTTVAGDRLPGRINILEASRPALLAIPGMTELLADAIIARRDRERKLAQSDLSRSPVWLLTENLVELPHLRRMGPWLTTGGDLFRGRAIGQQRGTQRAVSIDFLIDAVPHPAVILEIRE